MLQRGNSDAARRVRNAKKPPPTKRERLHPPSDPALLHEQAVVAAVRAHEIAYGMTRSSMDDDKTARSGRPSLERQGSHIVRHLSNASSKPARPKNIRKSASTARIITETTATPAASSRASTSSPYVYPSSEIGTNPSNRADRRSSKCAPDYVMHSLRSTPSSNKLSKKPSYTADRSAGSALGAPTIDRSQQAENHASSQAFSATHPDRPYERPRSMQTDDAMATVARERHPNDPQVHQTLRPSPSARSSLFLSRFDKFEQHSSTVPVPLDRPASPSNKDDRAGSVGGKTIKKSRRISVNITKTIRRAFGRRNVTPTAEIPPQQVQAHRPHYGSESTTASRRLSVSTLGGETVPDAGRSMSPTPTPSIYDRNQATRQHQTSTITSLDTYYTKSRVTSWMTNSSKDYTTKLHEVELQLPSIQESPRREVSQSGSTYPKLEHDTYDYAHQNLDLAVPQQRALDASPSKIDSKRLLSALRTQISGSQVRPRRSSDMRNASGSTNMSWQSADMTPIRNTKTPVAQAEDRIEMSASIRDFSTSEFPFDMAYMPVHDQQAATENQDPHYGMMSPSIYSFRAGVAEKQLQDSVLTLPQRSPSPGIAVISESHQVSKWSLKGQPSPSKSPNTSGEWRSWAADELADLGDAVSGWIIEPKHKPRNPFARMAERRASGKLTEAATSSSRENAAELSALPSPPLRPKLLGTSSDSMNDRFPMLPTGKKARPSPASSRKTSVSKSSAYDLDKDGESSLRQHSSSVNLRADHALPKKRSNLALHVMSTDDVNDSPPAPRSRIADKRRAARQPRKDTVLNEQPSLAHLVAKERSRGAESPRRQARLPTPLDDNFLLRIRKGPYAAQSSSSPEKADSSVESLDLLSRKKGTGVGGARQGVKTTDENSRPSPTRGQMMVDDFLGNRKSKRWTEIEEDVDEGHGSSPRFV